MVGRVMSVDGQSTEIIGVFRVISNFPRSPTPICLSRKRSTNPSCNGT